MEARAELFGHPVLLQPLVALAFGLLSGAATFVSASRRPGDSLYAIRSRGRIPPEIAARALDAVSDLAGEARITGGSGAERIASMHLDASSPLSRRSAGGGMRQSPTRV